MYPIQITKGRDSLSRPYDYYIFISPHSVDLNSTCCLVDLSTC